MEVVLVVNGKPTSLPFRVTQPGKSVMEVHLEALPASDTLTSVPLREPPLDMTVVDPRGHLGEPAVFEETAAAAKAHADVDTMQEVHLEGLPADTLTSVPFREPLQGVSMTVTAPSGRLEVPADSKAIAAAIKLHAGVDIKHVEVLPAAKQDSVVQCVQRVQREEGIERHLVVDREGIPPDQESICVEGQRSEVEKYLVEDGGSCDPVDDRSTDAGEAEETQGPMSVSAFAAFVDADIYTLVSAAFDEARLNGTLAVHS